MSRPSKELKLLGRRLIDDRLLFQPPLVDFAWFLPVVLSIAAFFDSSKSSFELLVFFSFHVSHFQVDDFLSFQDLSQPRIHIFGRRRLRPHSVQPLLHKHVDVCVKL